MEQEKKQQKICSSWLACFTKSFSISSSTPLPSPENGHDREKQCFVSPGTETTTRRKPGGWRSMPFVLGTETFERLAAAGLAANFTVFLLTVYHMDQVSVSNLMNISSGIADIIPLLGAYISDSYLGRFWTIAFGSIFEIMGMLTLTIIAWRPQLRPPPCNVNQSHDCKGPTKSQLGFLYMALGFLAMGSGGIRPCNVPFGVDQFDSTTESGRKGISSFFNWYYTSFTVVIIISLTIVVYIQDSISWALGFSIPTELMLFAVVLFFLGRRVYVYVRPEGSIFCGIAQVIVAAYKKRTVEVLDGEDGANGELYYDPPFITVSVVRKLHLTNDCRFLNKAAVITEGDLNPDGTVSSRWRLVSIHQMEEVKCIVRVIPVWVAGIVFLVTTQQGTFTMSQALKMDRHLGPNFQIPAGSLSVISIDGTNTQGVPIPLDK